MTDLPTVDEFLGPEPGATALPFEMPAWQVEIWLERPAGWIERQACALARLGFPAPFFGYGEPKYLGDDLRLWRAAMELLGRDLPP